MPVEEVALAEKIATKKELEKYREALENVRSLSEKARILKRLGASLK